MVRLVRIMAVQFVTRAPQDDLSAVTPEARDIVLSVTDECSAMDIVREFELELLDDGYRLDEIKREKGGLGDGKTKS